MNSQERNNDKPPIITIKNLTITYAGAISPSGADSVLAFINTDLYKELHIISGGGEIISAMKIGSAIFEKKWMLALVIYAIHHVRIIFFQLEKIKKLMEVHLFFGMEMQGNKISFKQGKNC